MRLDIFGFFGKGGDATAEVGTGPILPVSSYDPKPPAQEPSARKGFVDAGKTFCANLAARVAYDAASGRHTSAPSPLQEAVKDIAAENLFPEGLRKCLEVSVTQPFHWVASSLSGWFSLRVGSVDVGRILTYSALEEATFRGVLQEGLLKRLPQAVLDRVSPEHANLVNHKIAKVSRVVLAALIFALCHTDQWTEEQNGTLPQFMAGLLYGSLVEADGAYGLLPAIISHAAMNTLIFSARG